MSGRIVRLALNLLVFLLVAFAREEIVARELSIESGGETEKIPPGRDFRGVVVNCPWEVTPTSASGVFLGQATIGGEPAAAEDCVAAFDEEGNVAGVAQLIEQSGSAFINLVIYGDDTTTPEVDEGMNAGESFTLKLFDASSGEILESVANPFTGWQNTQGSPMPGYDDPFTVYDFGAVTCPWEVTPTSASGVFLGQATIGGEPAAAEDCVAAFDEGGHVAGVAQLIEQSGSAFINLVIYGDDTTTPEVDEGMNAGESFTLKLFDASSGEMLECQCGPFTGWQNTQGSPMPGYDDPFMVYGFGGNQAPSAENDVVTTDEDTPVTIEVLTNDSDPEGDVLSVESVTDPPHGTATDNGDGTITYTPELNFNGTDTFDYTVSDGNGGTATATVTVTINPVNDAPGPAVLTAPEDGASILIEGAPDATLQVSWMQAEDPDGDGLTYVWELAMSETFETVLHREEVGAVTQFELAYATVAGLLTEQGIGPNESVHVFHRVVSSDGALETPGSPFSLQLTRGTIVSKEDDGSLPERYVFSGNYPNPFRTITTFRFALPQPGHVKLEVYNLLGKQVATVVEGVYPAGWHTARWDATGLVSGIYFVRMQGKDIVISQAVTLIQ